MDPITKYILNEGYLLSDKTIAVNLQDFESGKKNKLLLVGVMGSGKTTWAEFLSKNKAYMVDGRYPARLPRVKWISLDSLWWRIGQKHFKQYTNKNMPKKAKAKMEELFSNEVYRFLNNNERMIIEGISLVVDVFDIPKIKKSILKQPMIIMGMSALRAGLRGGKRNMGREGGEGWRELYWMPKINMREVEPDLKKFRKIVKGLPNVVIEPYEIPSLD